MKTTKQRYIELPSEADELTADDWAGLLKIREKAIDRRLSLTDVVRLSAHLLLRNRGVAAPRGNQTSYLHLVGQLSKSLDWLWVDTDDGFLLRQGTARQLLPTIGLLQGPGSYGDDMLFGEFRLACDILQRGGDDDLCALAGLLWRPVVDGKRQAYDADTLGEAMERGRRMTRWQRWGASSWMNALLESFTDSIFTIDGEDVSFAPLFSSDGDGDGKGSLARVRLTLAQSQVFGDADSVDHTPLLAVLLKLLMDYEEYEKLTKKKK